MWKFSPNAQKMLIKSVLLCCEHHQHEYPVCSSAISRTKLNTLQNTLKYWLENDNQWVRSLSHKSFSFLVFFIWTSCQHAQIGRSLTQIWMASSLEFEGVWQCWNHILGRPWLTGADPVLNQDNLPKSPGLYHLPRSTSIHRPPALDLVFI